MILSMKQKYTLGHCEQTCDCQQGGLEGGDWGQQNMNVIIYRMDKQGLTVQYGKLYSIFYYKT